MKLKNLIAPVVVGLLVAGTASAFTAWNRPWTVVATDASAEYRVRKVCDAGRAVYIGESYYYYNRGVNAIAVVENAPECTFGAR